MAKASINFQKTKANSVAETTRQFEANYLLPKQYRKKNEYWSIGRSDEEVFYTELAKAKRKGGRIPKPENSLWEAVLNLNENHTMEDVKKVAEHIEKKFNIICTRIAIHRDEGKVFVGNNGSETVKYNYHAHLNFVTYKDGKQNWRRALIRKQDLAELQTEVAEILGMERGKVNSPNVRANHRELRKNYDKIMKQRESLEKVEQLEQELEQKNLTVKELKAEIEKYRKELIERNKQLSELQERVYTAEDYRALQALKKELKKDNLEEIYKAFVELKSDYDERFRQMQAKERELLEQVREKDTKIEQLEKVNNALNRKLLGTQKENTRLKEQVQQLQDKNNTLLTQSREKDRQIERLQEENKNLLQGNRQLKQQVQQLQLQPKLEPKVVVKEKIVYREDTEKVEKLKKELEEQKRKNAELTEELRKKEQKIRELNEKLDKIEMLLNKNMQRVKELEELAQKQEREQKQDESIDELLNAQEPKQEHKKEKKPKKSRNQGFNLGL